MKTFITVQAEGHDYDITELEKKVKEEIKSMGVKVKSIEKVELYVQPLLGLCYYVSTLDDKRTLKGCINL